MDTPIENESIREYKKALVEKVKAVENPNPFTRRFNDPRYVDGFAHRGFEEARQAIIKIIEEGR